MVVWRAKQLAEMGILVHAIPVILVTEVAVIGHCDSSLMNMKKGATQGGYIVAMTERQVYQGKVAAWVPMVWKSYRLRRAASSTFNSETQACRDCVGHLIFMANMLCEVKYGEYTLLRRNDFVRRLGGSVVVDCKPVYDFSNNLGAACFALAKQTGEEYLLEEAAYYFQGAVQEYRKSRGQKKRADVITKNLMRVQQLLSTDAA